MCVCVCVAAEIGSNVVHRARFCAFPGFVRFSSPLMERTSVRVCVFDFDETLAVSNGVPGVHHLELFGGSTRLAELRSLLEDIAGAGVLLAIVSFNSKAVISPLVEAAGLAHLFPDALIFGHEVYEDGGALRNVLAERYGTGFVRDWRKSSVIQELVLPAARGCAEGLLFVDDDPANIHDVCQSLPGSQSVLAPSGGLREFGPIRRWLVSPVSTTTIFDAPTEARSCAEV